MPTFVVEGTAKLVDNVEITLTADSLEDAEDEALQALKDYYPEYDEMEVEEVKQVNG